VGSGRMGGGGGISEVLKLFLAILQLPHSLSFKMQMNGIYMRLQRMNRAYSQE
jgi:hypothetical protein